jgi:preprotein translocase subunit SecG
MTSVFIGIFTFVLILLALFLVLVVLAQKAKSDSGMAAMGGGMMESAFGPDTSNVLSRVTIKAAVAFFVLSFVLYLSYVYVRSHGTGAKEELPTISVPATPKPAPANASAAPPATAPAVSVQANAAPDAAKTTTQSGTAPKSP